MVISHPLTDTVSMSGKEGKGSQGMGCGGNNRRGVRHTWL